MSIFYHTRAKSQFHKSYDEIDANMCYLTHFTYLTILSRFSRDTTISFLVRCDVEAEIKIAHRKIAYHMRHANFVLDVVQRVSRDIKSRVAAMSDTSLREQYL